jgi:hypothetical protein
MPKIANGAKNRRPLGGRSGNAWRSLRDWLTSFAKTLRPWLEPRSSRPGSDVTIAETGGNHVTEKQAQKDELALQPYKDRPVGRPPGPDLSAMTEEELDTRRDAVGRLRDLFKKAEKGNKKAVPEIWEILEESPDLAWRFMDFATLAECRFIDNVTKDKDLASRETMEFQLAAMREEIAGENPSPLERLLAERIVFT